MKSQHVIQVSAYYPPHLGGQEHAVQALSRQLVNAGHQVDVLTSSHGSKEGTYDEKGIRINRLRGGVFGHAPIMPAFLATLCRLVRADSVVHVHIGQAFTPEMVWLASKLRGFNYVAQLHIDFKPSGPAGILLPMYKQFVLGPVLRAASQIITLNQETLDTVRTQYGAVAAVLDNGIDDAYFTLERQPLPARPPRPLRLLFVGRLTAQKNCMALLDALVLTKRPVHLDIIGDGELRKALEQQIREYRLTNVTMHGRLPREKVMEFYTKSHALIMPSLYEAQPLVLLEALAARIPIIGTNVIGVAEHLQDTGIIVTPTASGLAEGIAQYYEIYHSLPEMVARGYESASQRRWPATLKKYEEVYAAAARN